MSKKNNVIGLHLKSFTLVTDYKINRKAAREKWEKPMEAGLGSRREMRMAWAMLEDGSKQKPLGSGCVFVSGANRAFSGISCCG